VEPSGEFRIEGWGTTSKTTAKKNGVENRMKPLCGLVLALSALLLATFSSSTFAKNMPQCKGGTGAVFIFVTVLQANNNNPLPGIAVVAVPLPRGHPKKGVTNARGLVVFKFNCDAGSPTNVTLTTPTFPLFPIIFINWPVTTGPNFLTSYK